MKSVPAFDGFNLTAEENIEFGDATTNARHFTPYSLRHATGKANAQLDSDLPTKINMMNPMRFIQAKNSARAKHWWIRVGTGDTDTSLTIVGNLAANLHDLGDDVNALMYWCAGHAISWIAGCPKPHTHTDSSLSRFRCCSLLGGLGPGIAAFTVMRVLRGGEGDDELLGPLLRRRVGIVGYLVAIFGFIAIWLIAAGISGEVGWRGFALPRLQVPHNALVSSLIVGVLWALWHLRLLLNADDVMSTYPLAPSFVYVIAESVLYGWLYYNVRGSLLIVVIFHAMSNTFGVFSPTAAAVTLVFAAVVVAIFGPAHLSRTVERVVPPART